MRQDSRLSVALHVLLHMSDADRMVTSEELADRLRMNAVVLRRTLARLRGAGIVRGDKGHGGGWALERRLASVSLADVLAALDCSTLFAIGPRDPKTRCPIEQHVDRAIGGVLDEAQRLVTERLGAISVASVIGHGQRRLRHTKEIHAHV